MGAVGSRDGRGSISVEVIALILAVAVAVAAAYKALGSTVVSKVREIGGRVAAPGQRY